jgi:hypothetical protein
MERYAILVCAVALMAGCGSSTTPSNQPTVFTVQIRASSEVPPVTDSESGASGTAVITVNPVRDTSGNITGGTIDFNVTLSGFPNDSLLTAAHIHPGAAGVNGGVLIGTGISSADNIVTTNGSATFSRTNVDAASPNSTAATNIQNMLANPAGFYFNVHTQRNPRGVARGQLR